MVRAALVPLLLLAALGGGPAIPTGLAQTSACFGTASSFSASHPVLVKVADVNHDREPDLVTSSGFGSSISAMLGNGDGTFQAQQSVSVGFSVGSMAIGDLNGDGNVDVIASYGGSAAQDYNIAVLLGNGNGTFRVGTPSYIAGILSVQVAIGDVNRDGKPDLIAVGGDSRNGTASVRVLLGKGDGTFQSPASFTGDDSPQSVAITDLNNDGKPDVVTVNSGGSVAVLLGNGDGTFQAKRNFTTSALAYDLAIADLNRDGKLDLVTASHNYPHSTVFNTVSVLLGKGDGTFQAVQSFAVGSTSPESVAVGDLNGDGKPDVATASAQSNNVSVLLGNGDGTLGAPQAFGVGALPLSVAIGDFNRDSKPDLAVANSNANTVSVLLNVCNSAPVITVPGAQTTLEDTARAFSTGASNAITIADPDAGTSALQVSLTADNGTLTLGGTAGLSGLSGNGTGSVSFSASQSASTTALNGLTYAPSANFHGTDTLVITANDQGHTGNNGPQSSNEIVAITVTAANDRPVLTMPSAQTTPEDTALIFSNGANNAIGVADLDGGAVKVTLTVTNGLLTLNGTGGLVVTGNGTASIVATGPTVGVNAALNGLRFAPTAGFKGAASLQIQVDDLANGGSSALQASGTVAITVAAVSRIGIADVTVTEGNSGTADAAFTVTLAPSSSQVVTVQYATADGSATAPGDYLSRSGTLTFQPGETSKTIAVPVVGDTVSESSEAFTVTLSAPTNAALLRAQAVGSISDNDSVSPVAQACAPRPRVQTQLVPGGGKLTVRIEATPLNTLVNNGLHQVRFGTFQNARVTLNGQPVASGQIYVVPDPANTHGVDFVVERLQAGQATTVPLTLVDGCGAWQTFVGGGPSAF
jgi:hypothetical protein